MLSLGFGCKKEADQVDRYKVFSASWEESYYTMNNGRFDAGTITQKMLIKFDSATGRVWCWKSLSKNYTNCVSEWLEMTDSGYVSPTPESKK
jgi:hypothetical protein